jgi:hypothetical protein
LAATSTPAPALRPTTSGDLAEGYRLYVHPDGPLYAGDLVSFEVVVPVQNDKPDGQVSIQVDPPAGPVLATVGFSPFGIGGRLQATFRWAWNTVWFSPGTHTLEITVQPDGPVWQETLLLLPADEQPALEREAIWVETQIPCCHLRYITGTAAERDLVELLPLIEAQSQGAASSLGVLDHEPISIVLLPRLLGHGGFALDEIYVSYLDRSYAGRHPDIVLHHEMIHFLDGQFGGEFRPTILAEGLAVYFTRGHYKVEPLFPRAAALVELGWYLPLEPLSDAFYFSQHEVGYLEAGALVEYMVDTWGLDAVLDFYHNIQPQSTGSQAGAIDKALRQQFGLSYAALEASFLAALEPYPVNSDLLADVRLTVRLYETLRRYQQVLDPSAYFLSAWLPDIDELPQNNLVADYVRRPSGVENIALETMLFAAGDHLQAGQYLQAGRLLGTVNAVLDRIEAGEQGPFWANRLSADYLALVALLQERGYQVQQIQLDGDAAIVWAYGEGIELVEITAARLGDQAWVILSRAD